MPFRFDSNCDITGFADEKQANFERENAWRFADRDRIFVRRKIPVPGNCPICFPRGNFRVDIE
jgi:hypothetical protein